MAGKLTLDKVIDRLRKEIDRMERQMDKQGLDLDIDAQEEFTAKIEAYEFVIGLLNRVK